MLNSRSIYPERAIPSTPIRRLAHPPCIRLALYALRSFGLVGIGDRKLDGSVFGDTKPCRGWRACALTNL